MVGGESKRFAICRKHGPKKPYVNKHFVCMKRSGGASEHYASENSDRKFCLKVLAQELSNSSPPGAGDFFFFFFFWAKFLIRIFIKDRVKVQRWTIFNPSLAEKDLILLDAMIVRSLTL